MTAFPAVCGAEWSGDEENSLTLRCREEVATSAPDSVNVRVYVSECVCLPPCVSVSVSVWMCVCLCVCACVRTSEPPVDEPNCSRV